MKNQVCQIITNGNNWNETEVEILLDEKQLNNTTLKEKNFKELENFVLKIKFEMNWSRYSLKNYLMLELILLINS